MNTCAFFAWETILFTESAGHAFDVMEYRIDDIGSETNGNTSPRIVGNSLHHHLTRRVTHALVKLHAPDQLCQSAVRFSFSCGGCRYPRISLVIIGILGWVGCKPKRNVGTNEDIIMNLRLIRRGRWEN